MTKGTSLALAVHDYIDPDVAYLYGMILMRGAFHIEGDIRRLVIRFPFRLDHMTCVPNSNLNSEKRRTMLRLDLDTIRERITELLEVTPEIQNINHEVLLRGTFTRNTMSWRNLHQNLCQGRSSYNEFQLPDWIFEVSDDIARELLRGVADAAAEPSHSDRDQAGRQRIVIPFPQANWLLPTQLCRFLQEKLGVPVANIIYGHPNLRDPKGTATNWAKEHRLRIFAEDFEPIGFHFEYKQAVFSEMVAYNRANFANVRSRACNPKAKKIRSRKPRHPDEAHARLPECLRSTHFNAYFKICQALGCKQGRRTPQLEFLPTENGDED